MIPELAIVALHFYREPHRFPNLLDPQQPLPPGITELLAASTTIFSESRIDATAAKLNAAVQECREAVPFFVKRVLIDTGGDYYRTLGVPENADNKLIKQHYHFLIRLFHPDRDDNNESWEEFYAPRINKAYNTLRSPGKRLEYDRNLVTGCGSSQEWGDMESVQTNPPESYQPSPRRRTASRQRSKPTLSPQTKRVALILVFLVTAGISALTLFRPNPSTLRIEAVTRPVVQQGVSEMAVEGEGEVPTDEQNQSFADNTDPAGEFQENNIYSSDQEVHQTVEETVRLHVAQATAAVVKETPKIEEPPREVEAEQSIPEEKQVEIVSQNRDLEQTQVPTEEPPREVEAEQSIPEEKQVEIVSQNQDLEQTQVPTEELTRVEAEFLPAKTKLNEMPGATIEITTEDNLVDIAIKDAAPVLTVAEEMVVQEPGTVADQIEKSPEIQVEPKTTVADQGNNSNSIPNSISHEQTLMLLAVMMSSFESGNLERFVDLFSEDARTNDANGKTAIHQQYKQYFARPELRKISVSRLQWMDDGSDGKTGSGEFYLTVTPLANGQPPSISVTELKLGLQRYPSGLKIRSLYY